MRASVTITRRQILQTSAALIAVAPISGCQAVALHFGRLLAFWLGRKVFVWLGSTALTAELRIVTAESAVLLVEELARLGLTSDKGTLFEFEANSAVVSIDDVNMEVTVSALERVQNVNLYAWLYPKDWSSWENIRWLWFWGRRARIPVHTKGFYLGQGLTIEQGNSTTIPMRDVIELGQFSPGEYEFDITVVDQEGEKGRSQAVRLAVLPSDALARLSAYGGYRTVEI